MDNYTKLLYGILIILIVLCIGLSAYEYNRYTKEYKLPYKGESFVNHTCTWDKPVVNISVVGKNPNWDKVQDVMNEWNTVMTDAPKLAYNDTYPDITLQWSTLENESWAGGTWWNVTPDYHIKDAHIIIRTSWPFNREHVIRHELGHAMGLSYHSNHPNSTMYKYATGVPKWSQEDIDMVNQLY
jgi:hypothetical protein